jgi:hypothetical protein
LAGSVKVIHALFGTAPLPGDRRACSVANFLKTYDLFILTWRMSFDRNSSVLGSQEKTP